LTQVKHHAIPDGICQLRKLAGEGRQMSTHLFKAAAISLLMPVVSGIGWTAPAIADEQSVRRGKAIAVAKCSNCHSIGRAGRSPRGSAPPFRNLHKQYPVETLEDALAEGMSTGHPRMPEFRLEPREVGAFISFLKSLE
jgi:cytochrome c